MIPRLADQDPKAQIIRVNQAGEQGAVRIYQGQMAALKQTEAGPILQHMLDQERVHLDRFNQQLVKNQIRPTLLSPLWSIAGFMLGYCSGLLGKEAAMACTVSVESVISKHYLAQESQLGEQDPELKELISQCRQEEEEHHDISLAQGAEQAPGYKWLSGLVKAGTKLAIILSKHL